MTLGSAVVAVGDPTSSYIFLISTPQAKSQIMGLIAVWSPPSTRLNEALESPPCLNVSTLLHIKQTNNK